GIPIRHPHRPHSFRYWPQLESVARNQIHAILFLDRTSILSSAPQFPSDYRPHGPRAVVRAPRGSRAGWKTLLAWIAGGLAALVFLVCLTVYVALHSRGVHRYVLR